MSALLSGKVASKLVPGLTVLESFISPEQEKTILEYIGAQKWPQRETSRLYGDGQGAPIPVWGHDLIRDMKEFAKVDVPFNQMRIHRYLPGEGILKHVDVASWGAQIVSLSLNAPCTFRFTKKDEQDVDLLLLPRAFVLMEDDCRNNWDHEIPSLPLNSEMRVSLTFRTTTDKTKKPWINVEKQDTRGLNDRIHERFEEQRQREENERQNYVEKFTDTIFSKARKTKRKTTSTTVAPTKKQKKE